MDELLYTIVDREMLHSMLVSFQGCISIPIQIIDSKGNVLDKIGESGNFCNYIQQFITNQESCEQMRINAGKQAVELGECYVYSCHANLNHIVFPLTYKKMFLGSVLAGPFLMDNPDASLIVDISKKYSISTKDALELYDKIGDISVLSPTYVNHVSNLLFYLFSNLIAESKADLRANNQKLLQQSKINESIQRYKEEENSGMYPYDKEKELIAKVKSGQVQDAKSVLNDLLGYALFSEGNSLNNVKARTLELCAVLSRATIEGGAPTDNILKYNNHFLQRIQQIQSFEQLCFELQEVVETFMDSMFNYIPTKNAILIKRAMAYISEKFTNDISLEDVAKVVNLSPTYFSSIFKQSTGTTFVEYLSMVRIEESKRLLLNTDYSVIDIAISVGFEDQSYFTKVFKKYTGMTPKQYRL